MNEITQEDIKACEEAISKEIRDDVYYMLEGITGCKSTSRAILRNFPEMLEKFGDTEELYDYYSNQINKNEA